MHICHLMLFTLLRLRIEVHATSPAHELANDAHTRERQPRGATCDAGGAGRSRARASRSSHSMRSDSATRKASWRSGAQKNGCAIAAAAPGRSLGAAASIARTRCSASGRCAMAFRLQRACARAAGRPRSAAGAGAGARARGAGARPPPGRGAPVHAPQNAAELLPEVRKLAGGPPLRGRCGAPARRARAAAPAHTPAPAAAAQRRGARRRRPSCTGSMASQGFRPRGARSAGRARLQDVEVALVRLAERVAAAGQAVVRQQAEAEHVGAAALARVAAAAADQLLRRLPAAAAACARGPPAS